MLDEATKARVLAVLKAPGEALQAPIAAAMERSFGASFSDVRVHRDAEAAATASQLVASAYTVDRHIVFASGEYAPHTPAGFKLLAHELTHVVQQRGRQGEAITDIVLGPDDDAFERDARATAAGVLEGAQAERSDRPFPAPAGEAVLQREKRVCGPDVSAQIASTWSQIETWFGALKDRDKKLEACKYLITPYIGFRKNIDAFDTLPVYYDGSKTWLLRSEILDVPCGIPSPLDNDRFADLNQGMAEDRKLCSTSVRVHGKCWLGGTVNYGTYGIMMSLCDKEFPTDSPYPWNLTGIPLPGFSIGYGENLIRAYKAHGGTASEPDVNEPIAWYRATFNGGPSARPLMQGNRSSCDASGKECDIDGSVVKNWDFVWEPYKPRYKFRADLDLSKIKTKPAPAPTPSAEGVEWAAGWWKVYDGNLYYYYFFGDGDVIYIKQAPNLKWKPGKTTGRKGKVVAIEHGMIVTWPPFSDEAATDETFTRTNWTSADEMLGTSTKYANLKATRLSTS